MLMLIFLKKNSKYLFIFKMCIRSSKKISNMFVNASLIEQSQILYGIIVAKTKLNQVVRVEKIKNKIDLI